MSQELDDSKDVSEVFTSASPSRFSSHFFDKDQAATERRKIYLKMVIGGVFATTVAFLPIFSIFWASLYQTPAHKFNGWIVDFDGDLIGQTVVQGLTGPSAAGQVVWHYRPTSDFINGVQDISDTVVNEDVWVAIVVNSLATQSLKSATSEASATYNGSSAITVYVNEARAENGYRSIIRPSVDGALRTISKQFAAQYLKSLATSPSIQTIAQNAPAILYEPISYTTANLRPFDVPVAIAATFIGLLYLLILTFFVVNIAHGAREAINMDTHLTLRSAITVRFVTSIVAYFWLSLFYSALSPAFGLPMERHFGHGGFLIFWMLNWFGMLACGLALESMVGLMTIRFIPFFLLLWIMVNVSVCFFPIEVLPTVFRYGYAVPFYNISKGTRTIIFGTYNRLGLNFGVLIVWTIISCITLPLFQLIARKRAIRSPASAEKQGGKA